LTFRHFPTERRLKSFQEAPVRFQPQIIVIAPLLAALRCADESAKKPGKWAAFQKGVTMIRLADEKGATLQK